MARVFISYAHENQGLAAEFLTWMTHEGHEVFLDQALVTGIAVGDDWEQRLYEQMRRADAMLCLVSGAYRDSVWCTAELAFARAQGCRVLPVLIESGVSHPLLLTEQFTDFARDPATSRSALAEALRRIDAGAARGWPDGRSPFPGLTPFDSDSRRVFFGRSSEIQSLAARLRGPSSRADPAFHLVVGPSGCGKSSLVRAGVLPIMAEDEQWWTLAAIVPGRDPVLALAREFATQAARLGLPWTVESVLARLTASTTTSLSPVVEDLLLAASQGRARSLLLVVDQAEELVTVTPPQQRLRFAQLLRGSLGGPLHVLGTARPEALADLLASRELSGLPLQTFALRPLDREMLSVVIEEPARMAGIGIEPGLVARLVADTGSGDALPLLAFTLAHLADGVGRGGVMSMRRYEALGGVRGALLRQADAALGAARAASGRAAYDVITGLLRLVAVDENGSPTRRRANRAELPSSVQIETEAFIRSRLLTTDRDSMGAVFVEVTHEAVFTAWPPLAERIAVAASTLRTVRVLEQAAAGWERAGRPGDQLWSGDRLRVVVAETGVRGRDARGTEKLDVSASARAFIAASIRRYRSRRVRLLTALSALMALVVVAAGAAVVAGQQRANANEQRRLAAELQRVKTAQGLIFQAGSLGESQPMTAMKLKIAAMALDPTSPTTRAGLVTAVLSNPLAGVLTGHSGPVQAVALSADASIALTGSTDDAAIVWNVGVRSRPEKLSVLTGHTKDVTAVALSRDGRTALTGSADGTAILWDLSSPARPAKFAVLTGHTKAVKSVAFAPDGRTAITGGGDGTAKVWDIGIPAQPTAIATLVHGQSDVVAVALDAGGRHALMGAGAAFSLWDYRSASGPQLLVSRAPDPAELTAVAFSPDGRRILTGNDLGAGLVWDITDPQKLDDPIVLLGHANTVVAVGFTPDGRTALTGGLDGAAIRWDLTDAHHPYRRTALVGHIGAVNAIAFSEDGQTTITGGEDHRALLWDLVNLSQPRVVAPLTLPGHRSGSPAINGTGTVALSADGSNLTVWDTSNPIHPRAAGTLTGHHAEITKASISDDGKTAITADLSGTSILWNLTDPDRPSRLATLPEQRGIIYGAGLSGDGLTALTSTNDDLLLWDLTNPARPRSTSLGASGLFGSVALSTSGKFALTSDDTDPSKSTAILWDLRDRNHPRRLATLGHHDTYVWAVAMSRDQRYALVGSEDNTADLWDISNPSAPRLLSTLADHRNVVAAVGFNPDGHTITTIGLDKLAIVWDITVPTQPQRLLTLDGAVVPLSVSIGGNLLLTGGSDDNGAILWDATPLSDAVSRPTEIACGITDGGLSAKDWAKYIPDLPYQRTCQT
jgi:WD40 repeat protein